VGKAFSYTIGNTALNLDKKFVVIIRHGRILYWPN